jgi:predicted glycosyltransferase
MAIRDGLRIAMYSQDGFGLGHLRRTTLIGEGLLRRDEVSAVLLFADSPTSPWFDLPLGMDCVKLPSMLKKDAGLWESTTLPIGTKDLLAIRGGVLQQALVAFRPDILLVDHMPGGARGELLAALEALKRECPGCRMVLGLRDILDSPEVTMRVWWQDKAYYALRQYYDSIAIYGARDMFDTAAAYLLPAPPGGIHYCGYTVNEATPRPAARVRARYVLADKKLVLVAAGGGADGHHLMRAYLAAVRQLGDSTPFFTLMTLGPYAPSEVRQELRDEAQGLPVRIVSRLDDSLSATAAADLVVCMAGYNTLSEVLHLRKKALVVPRPGPSAEQCMRAGLFARHRLIDALHPEHLSPVRLAERLLDDLERDDYPVQSEIPDMSGVRNAVAHLTAQQSAGRRVAI